MANRVSIIVRAQDRTRAGFTSVDRGLRRLQARLARASRDGARFGTLLRGTARGLGALRGGLRVAGRGVNALFSGVSSLTSALGQSKGAIGIMAAGLMALGPLASVLAGVLTVGLGAAFIGLGAAALKGDKDVRSAFGDMKSAVVSTVKDAAKPLKPFLIDGMKLVGSAAKQMKPQLTEAFRAAGPLVRPLTEGVIALAQNALPGFTASLKRSKPVMEGFRQALGSIGTGLGDMFRQMTAGDGAQALGDMWRRLGEGTRQLLSSVGKLMHTLTTSKAAAIGLAFAFGQLKLVIEAVNGAMRLVEGGIGLIDKATGGLVSKLKDKVTPATAHFKAQLGAAGDAATKGGRSVQSLIKAMQDLNNEARNSLDAQSAFEQAIDDVAEAAKKNAGALSMSKGQLDLNSQKSRDAYGALSQLAGATHESANAAKKNGRSWAYVNGIYDRGRQKLVKAAVQMGLTREEARKLADQILRTPNKTARLKGDLADLAAKVKAAKDKIRSVPRSKLSRLLGTLSDLQKKVAEAKRKIRSVPKSKRSALRATIGDLSRKIAAAKRKIASVKGKTVSVVTIFTDIHRTIRQNQSFSHESTGVRRAHGGVIGAAGGGPRAGTVLVGEQGPELVRLPGGASVIPSGQSERMMAASRFSDRPQVLEIRSGGTRLDDFLVEMLRRAIRVRGGDPAVVLSPRGR